MFRAVIIALVAGTIQTMTPAVDEVKTSDHLLASVTAETMGYNYWVKVDG